MKGILSISLPLLILDQLTKWLALQYIGEPIPIIPGLFNLVLVFNTGAAFGMLKNQNLLFITVSLVALGAMGWMFWKKAFEDNWSRVAGLLLIPGILGNLTDRLTRGSVVDFLDFYLGERHWPAFNVADSCICVAVGLFLIGSWKETKTRSDAPVEERTAKDKP